MSETPELKHLGQQSREPIDVVETLPWASRSPINIQLDCAEFTSHCPVTDQADFGNLSIVYIPADRIIETKSLKLFLYGYRDRRAFNEELVREILEALVEQVAPRWIQVTGHFNRRGGIAVTASLQWEMSQERLIQTLDGMPNAPQPPGWGSVQ